MFSIQEQTPNLLKIPLCGGSCSPQCWMQQRSFSRGQLVGLIFVFPKKLGLGLGTASPISGQVMVVGTLNFWLSPLSNTPSAAQHSWTQSSFAEKLLLGLSTALKHFR